MKNNLLLSYFLLSLVASNSATSFSNLNSVQLNDNISQTVPLETNNIIKDDVASNIKINKSPSIQVKGELKRILRRKDKTSGFKFRLFPSLGKQNESGHKLTPEKLKDILEGRIGIKIPGVKPQIIDIVVPLAVNQLHLFSLKFIDPFLSMIYYSNHFFIDTIFSIYIRTSANSIAKIHKSKAYLNNFEKNLIYYQYFNVIVDHYHQLLDGKLGKLINKTFAKAKKSHPKQYKIYVDSVDIIQEKFHPFSDVVFEKLFHFEDTSNSDSDDKDTSKQDDSFDDDRI